MALDFSKLLSKPLDDVKRPPALPAGTYFGQIKKYEFKESRFEDRESGTKPAIVEFTIQMSRADDSIAELLRGEDGQPLDVSKRQVSREMPLDGPNAYVTKSFIEGLGIATQGRTFGDTIPETLHAEVMFEVTQRAGKGEQSDRIYNDIRNLRAAA